MDGRVNLGGRFSADRLLSGAIAGPAFLSFTEPVHDGDRVCEDGDEEKHSNGVDHGSPSTHQPQGQRRTHEPDEAANNDCRPRRLLLTDELAEDERCERKVCEVQQLLAEHRTLALVQSSHRPPAQTEEGEKRGSGMSDGAHEKP
jgi:hypothetical protein